MHTNTINQLLGIKESYQAPAKMLEYMTDDQARPKLFDEFLKHESDLSYEWFQAYFEDEHSDRKAKKQDFTPKSISNLLAKLTGSADSYFEAAAGTGGIMIQSWVENKRKKCWYHVEELSERSVPFLIFNMAIRNMNGMVLRGDSLTGEFEEMYEVTSQDKYSTVQPVLPTNDYSQSSVVLMNPPFSAKWSAEPSLLQDVRFSGYGVLAPKSKADFAFLLHGYHRLANDGLMAIVLPHGVLFRGNAEGKIRKALLESGAIKAVIGLPANIFTNTSIPTAILILNKSISTKEVLFIDASKGFEKGKNVNLLTDDHLNKIVSAYKGRKEVDKFSHLADFEEIKDNDYNLNIPRYVDTFEEEEPIDLLELSKEMVRLNKEIQESEQSFLIMLEELAITEENKEMILAMKEVFKRGEVNGHG